LNEPGFLRGEKSRKFYGVFSGKRSENQIDPLAKNVRLNGLLITSDCDSGARLLRLRMQ
jgi:hypothetical protein